MAAIDCARAILKYVKDVEKAVTFVAIAGAESGWRKDACGDCIGGTWSCWCATKGARCTSWGPWQVHVSAHYPWLKDLAGSADPCTIANWLTANYENNALAAYTVYRRAGNSFCPWTTYEKWCSPRHNGRYRDFLPQARAAVQEAIILDEKQRCIAQGGTWDEANRRCIMPPPPSPPPIEAGIPILAALGAVAFGGAGIGLIAFAQRERIGNFLQKTGIIKPGGERYVSRWRSP